MQRIPVQEARARLAQLIEAGTPIEITRYGKPVARLQPYPPRVDSPEPPARNEFIPPGHPPSWGERQRVQRGRDDLLRKR